MKQEINRGYDTVVIITCIDSRVTHFSDSQREREYLDLWRDQIMSYTMYV